MHLPYIGHILHCCKGMCMVQVIEYCSLSVIKAIILSQPVAAVAVEFCSLLYTDSILCFLLVTYINIDPRRVIMVPRFTHMVMPFTLV